MILSTARTEFFSDCIIAIAITIMVFGIGTSIVNEITLSSEWTVFVKMMPGILIYLLSFMMLGIMWVGHHNFYHVTQHVDVKLLWHNLHVLFWLTLVPFSTSMVGKYPLLPAAIAMYGLIMLMLSLAFALSRHYVLQHNLLLESEVNKLSGTLNKIARIKQIKTKIAMWLYLISIPLSFFYIPLAYLCIVMPAVLYLLPDEVKNKFLATSLYRVIRENR